MFENLTLFRMAQAMAMHAGTRQALVAQNMANADTPGYVAKDITPFADLVVAGRSGGFAPRASRPGHLLAPGPPVAGTVAPRPGAQADVNGNSVAIETEMLAAVDVKRQHDRALMIYRSSLNVLRTAIGRG